MGEARCTLSIGGLSHARAFEVMDAIESHLALDAVAVTINETDEAAALWETVAWFETQAESAAAQKILAFPHAVIALVPVRDWVRESLQGLNPVIAGRFFLHGSHDRHLRRSNGISLEIDAGTAFGTGHHGTTAGCLVALDEILKRHKPKRILDLGTGTGVLALAAAKALKCKVLATDIDGEAVRVTKLNAQLNYSGQLLHAVKAAGLQDISISQKAPYDLIFANILARPLALLASGLCEILKPGGHIILSGLTFDQLRWIRACYQTRGLAPVRIIRQSNWIALVMSKPARKSRTPKGARLLHPSKGSGYAEDI